MLKSVRSLKAELSACLRRVQSGEECLVTSHQQIVARIVPVQSPTEIEDRDRSNFLMELATNLITPKKSHTPLSKAVIQQRRKERY